MTMHQCPECGAALPEGSPEGLCPQCLLQQALKTQTDAGANTTSSGKTTQYVANLPTSGAKIKYFGDYEILEEIARGGMGVVYKARQIKLNRIVAVKMILAGNLASETEVKRFLLEAQAAANLQHPNIVAIHEVGEFNGQHYFSMDYVEGKNLADVCKDGPLPVAKAAQYLKTMTDAVHFAHQRGTLHRDLKPQNVLVDCFDQPRITDFGLAKQISKESSLTLSSMVMGSPSYMPPEQAAGRNDQVGPPSDVYSLGAILYQLLTGRAPFVGANALEVMRQVREEEPVAPSKLNRKIPSDLETICLKCLEKKPERRYASARALAEDLERFQNHEPIEARRPSATRRVMSWTLRHPWPLTGAASIILLVIVGLLFGVWEENKHLRWQMEHAGRQPIFKLEDFFSPVFQAFLSLEFFVLQILPLIFFIRDRVRELLTRSRLAKYAAVGFGQVGFGLWLIFKLNAALVWTTPSQWFSAAIALAALTNIWFGFRLLWHTGHEFRTLQSGGLTGGPPLALIRLAKYYPLFILLGIEAGACAFYASQWDVYLFCVGVVFGTNLLALMGRMLWLARGEERIIYLPPLLLSGVMILLGLDAGDGRTRSVVHALGMVEVLGMGLLGSVALFFLVRLERSLTPRISPLLARLKQKWSRTWRLATYAAWSIPVLVAAFYVVEDWRGQRVWEKTKAELLAKGAHLDWEFYKPKPVPDEQNLMKAPIMETWFLKNSPLTNTPLARRYKQFPGIINQWPPVAVPPVELVVVTPDAKVEVPADAVVYDLADLQSNPKRFASLCSRWPGSRGLELAYNSYLIGPGPVPGQKAPPVYLRTATRQNLSQLQSLFKKHGLIEPGISPARKGDGNEFEVVFRSGGTAEDLIRATDTFQPEYDQIRAALRRPGCYLHSSSEVAWEYPMANFVAARTFAQLMDSRARAYLLLNRPNEAWQEVGFLKDFCRCLESNSWNLVSAMIDVAITGLYVSTVEKGMALQGWTPEQFAQIQGELEKINLIPIVQGAFMGERAATLQLLELPPDKIARVLPGRETALFALVPQGWKEQNKRVIAQQFQRIIEILDVSAATVSPRLHEELLPALQGEWSSKSPYNYLASFAIPNFLKATQTMAKNQTRANLAAGAFALERYRVKYGQYPEKLEALVPEFKAKLPHDIVNGEPLKYRREAPDRFILYSIGWNLQDDGGKPGQRTEEGDWVWESYP